jgi:hypothetical protein
MSNEITITLPAIDEQLIANLDTLTTEASATEVEALKAIREKYAPLARQNGFVRIGWMRSGDGSNWSEERSYYYERSGKKIRALKVYDGFEQPNTTQNTGSNTGDRLYLLETGEWLRIERTGSWSQMQGATQEWSCGPGILDRGYDDPSLRELRDVAASEGYTDPEHGSGSIRTVTDAEVEAEYPFDEILTELAKSLKTLQEKLPARMTKVQQRVALASQLLAALA